MITKHRRGLENTPRKHVLSLYLVHPLNLSSSLPHHLSTICLFINSFVHPSTIYPFLSIFIHHPLFIHTCIHSPTIQPPFMPPSFYSSPLSSIYLVSIPFYPCIIFPLSIHPFPTTHLFLCPSLPSSLLHL